MGERITDRGWKCARYHGIIDRANRKGGKDPLKYRTARPALLMLFAGLILALGMMAAGALRARMLLRTALDGRRIRAQEESGITRFDLLAETVQSQTRPRMGGWLSIVPMETVTLIVPRGRLSARMYGAVSAQEDAPWALVFHGGLGTDSLQVQDIACELSLAGYRVLTPDLYAHGESEGEISSLGGAEAEDVRAWVQWIMGEDEEARIVLMGQDEGALAVLTAVSAGLPDAVRAAATDSAYTDVAQRARTMLTETGLPAEGLDMLLLGAAYRLANGLPMPEEMPGSIGAAAIPLLLLHGTGDQDVPAWHSEDIVLAAGKNAQLYYVEGAAHGMARYVDPQGYYDTLIGFFDRATGKTPQPEDEPVEGGGTEAKAQTKAGAKEGGKPA